MNGYYGYIGAVSDGSVVLLTNDRKSAPSNMKVHLEYYDSSFNFVSRSEIGSGNHPFMNVDDDIAYITY